MLKDHESTPALKRKEQKIKIKIKNRRKKNTINATRKHKNQPNPTRDGKKEGGMKGRYKKEKKESQTKTPENFSQVDTSKTIFCHPT